MQTNSTFAWYQVEGAAATADKTNVNTLTAAEAEIDGVTLDVYVSTEDTAKLMLTDDSGHAKVWNGETLVDATYGVQYYTVTVAIKAHAGEDYTQFSGGYNMTVLNTNTGVRITNALTSGHVGADVNDMYMNFSFGGGSGFNQASATIYFAITAPHTGTGAYDAGDVDTAPISSRASDWTFTITKGNGSGTGLTVTQASY